MSEHKTGKSRRQSSYAGDESTRCELCNGKHALMSFPEQWTSHRAREFVLSQGVSLLKLICQPCRNDISRVLNNPTYKPRWEKSGKAVVCCVQGCKEHVIACSKMITKEKSTQLFEDAGLECSSETIPVPTPLCSHHYHMLYNRLHPTPTNCSTCGSSLKHVTQRQCPNPLIIQSHLIETAGFEGSITCNDKVCYNCYKSHLVILNANKQVSRDSDLLLEISTLKHNAKAINELGNLQHVLDAAVNQTTIMVAEELLHRQVLHLPAVHDFLCNHAETLAVTANLGTQGDIHKSVTCMWVLSSLKANLQHHITYRCPVCKYGTLIFRPNTDLIPSLQKTMWRLRQLECTAKSFETNIKSQHLDDLNHRIH